MDKLSKADRSAMMGKIRGAGTKPEIIVRRTVHAMGFRFRLHQKDLPGRPDLVLHRHRKVIFVHGCFWHRHEGCKYAYHPKSNVTFWTQKFEKNIERDRNAISSLEEAGWQVLVVWECETRDTKKLKQELAQFLSLPPTGGT